MGSAMDKQDFEREMERKVSLIEDVLKDYLPKDVLFQKTIFDAVEYSLMGGGKRLRPLIIWESYLFFDGADPEAVKGFMAAMEMIHTYSLVHDDLPAMDDDEYRRGRRTTHIVYGEDMGILAGDALLNYAYEVVAGTFSVSNNTKNVARAFQILSQKAGVFGMVGGQAVDVERTGKPLKDDVLQFIYRLKTGALLEASFMIGAALAGASEEELEVMEEIGTCVGFAFQIQDDILDVTGNADELGKPIHSDEKNEKTTYVTLHGIEESKKAVKEYSQKAVLLLKGIEGKRGADPFLNKLIDVLVNRKK